MYDDTDIKAAVRERYAGAATAEAPGCASAGCGCAAPPTTSGSTDVGYTAEELSQLPEGADLGLGCGNPLALLDLAEGERVLDLGSGGGIDCFLAAKRVGESGHVIGVDMTPQMIDRARANAAKAGVTNVEFRLGEIEHLPVADGAVDAIISNCVINLAPDKPQVFREAFRVLAPGGRFTVSDIVLLGELPDAVSNSVEAFVACLAGAVGRDEYLAMLVSAGFENVQVKSEHVYSIEDVAGSDTLAEMKSATGMSDGELAEAARLFASVTVSARKPLA
jgi:ubiquinone/menaquinone biosynthesis C-methylase UbiE